MSYVRIPFRRNLDHDALYCLTESMMMILIRSIGRGVGSFAGGIMMANFGTRTTFRILGAGAGICGLVYFLLHRFYLARLEKNRLQRKSISNLANSIE